MKREGTKERVENIDNIIKTMVGDVNDYPKSKANKNREPGTQYGKNVQKTQKGMKKDRSRRNKE